MCVQDWLRLFFRYKLENAVQQDAGAHTHTTLYSTHVQSPCSHFYCSLRRKIKKQIYFSSDDCSRRRYDNSIDAMRRVFCVSIGVSCFVNRFGKDRAAAESWEWRHLQTGLRNHRSILLIRWRKFCPDQRFPVHVSDATLFTSGRHNLVLNRF